jgi:hypothetical protein
LYLIAPEINGLGWYRAVLRAKFGVKTVYFRQYFACACVPFHPGNVMYYMQRTNFEEEKTAMKGEDSPSAEKPS